MEAKQHYTFGLFSSNFYFQKKITFIYQHLPVQSFILFNINHKSQHTLSLRADTAPMRWSTFSEPVGPQPEASGMFPRNDVKTSRFKTEAPG